MIYEPGTKLVINCNPELTCIVIEDHGEGNILVRVTDGIEGCTMHVAWDRVRRLTKLDLALK